jgi:hypothetical protein
MRQLMNTVSIDFEQQIGKVKPMHAVNNMQSVPYDMYGGFEKFEKAHIPYSRLHDTGGGFGGSRYVDVANIFRDFDADENDPESYDFAFTDVLLSAMCERGVKPFYRLGATIENRHKIKAYNIYPPADFAKWARICEHIILHYNEGWANGFHMGIEYWEIWNEPDNQPLIEDNPCWKGTKEQFFEFYRVASTYLKKKFPHLKIGGYASCGFSALTNTFIKSANSSPRTEYFLEFFEDFLKYAKENSCVLDFFSWHSYAGVEKNIIYAEYAKERLNAYGFKDSLVFLNEWNTGNINRSLPRDAADVLSMMIAMQSTSTDMCMYYNAWEHSTYCGIFNPVDHGVFKTYYSFFIFGQLFAMKNQCYSRVSGEKIFAMAAKGEGKMAFAIVNDSENEQTVELSVKGAALEDGKVMATDSEHDFDRIEPLSKTVTLPPFSIRYVEF